MRIAEYLHMDRERTLRLMEQLDDIIDEEGEGEYEPASDDETGSELLVRVFQHNVTQRVLARQQHLGVAIAGEVMRLVRLGVMYGREVPTPPDASDVYIPPLED